MKKLLIVILVALTSMTVFGQTNAFPENGNVGIGTLQPNAKVEIKLSESGKGLQLIGENKNVEMHLGHTGSSHGYYWRYKGEDSGNNNDLELWTNNQSGTDLQVYNIHQDGNIQFIQRLSIGCEAVSGFKLAVNGAIRATEIKVESTGGADFVFEDDYQLKSLEEVEQFVEENNHLPDIPSAKQMEEKGVGLAEMNKLLLQKVEELTLYVIEQQKEIVQLKANEEKINQLESAIQLLMNQSNTNK